jgi:hypothetical protein
MDTGLNHDMNWMLRDLGLDEILFHPPPAGRQPKTFTPAGPATDFDDEDEDDDETVALSMNPALPFAPPLPNRPFTAGEVDVRLRAAVELHEFAADATGEMASEGCTLIDDVAAETVELVDDESFALLVPLLLQIWRAFVPAGSRGLNVSRMVLRQAILRETNDLTNALKQSTPAALERYLTGGAQPVLAPMILGQLLSLSQTLPKKARPSPERLAIMGAVLRAVIEELDRAQRTR